MKLVLDKLSKVYHVMVEDDVNKTNHPTSSSINNLTQNTEELLSTNNQNTKIYNQQILVSQKLANTGAGL